MKITTLIAMKLVVLLVLLAAPRLAQASEYWCNAGELVLEDCAQLSSSDEILLWPVGRSLAVLGGECTACPNPSPYGEETPDCDESGPDVSVYQDDTWVDTEWELDPTAPCDPLYVLTTVLEPGEYEIAINEYSTGDGFTSVLLADTGDTDDADTGDAGDADTGDTAAAPPPSAGGGSGGGCAASAAAGSSGGPNLPLWIFILGALACTRVAGMGSSTRARGPRSTQVPTHGLAPHIEAGP
jgi:hypothetical protein